MLGSLAGAGAASADTGASFAGCPQLDEGDTGPCITQLQQKLTKVHPEYNLPADSETFGPATRIALLDFQGRNHLGADGRFGTTTARELDRQYAAATRGAVASPTTKPVEPTPKAGSSLPGCPQLDLGDNDPCVAQLQNLLNKVHPEYQLPGSQTYGPQTRAAVADFQERNHITGGNGQFGPGTARALQAQASDVSPKTTNRTAVEPVDPNKECLDQGKIRGKSGDCVSDGVEKLGKPASECAKEIVGKKLKDELKKNLKKGMTREAAEAAAKATAAETAKQIAKKASGPFSVFKCMFWDKPGS